MLWAEVNQLIERQRMLKMGIRETVQEEEGDKAQKMAGVRLISKSL